MKNINKIACLSLIAAATMPVAANTFTPVTLPDLDTNIRGFTDGGTYSPLFTAGSQTLGGVPFKFTADADGDTAYIGWSGAALHIPVNVAGVTTAYTLINNLWGTAGSLAGTLTFNGSGGLSYGVNLVVGSNVRDHFLGTYVNTTSDPTTVDAVWGNPGSGAHLDMQAIALPAAFAGATLEEIVFQPLGGNPGGRAFLVASTISATSSTVPDSGSTLSLFGMAIGCLFLLRRGAGASAVN